MSITHVTTAAELSYQGGTTDNDLDDGIALCAISGALEVKPD